MNKIKELREKTGLSQEKLAEKLEVNLRTLQRWENNETAIRKKNAEKLADFFNVSVPYLLGYDEAELSLKEAQNLISTKLELSKEIAFESTKVYKNIILSTLELLDLLKKKARAGELKTETLIATIETLENFNNNLDKTIQKAIDSHIEYVELNRLKRELESSKDISDLK